ncbi:hypothetical protein BKA62DRAFT_703537 [Auriculariales sp. MPI-PUGE-AT-0066]|nr:hypothetical protein BKA62DRAFT_703537 [Auriculariales sp. MPI-PUGE-AT-0066]
MTFLAGRLAQLLSWLWECCRWAQHKCIPSIVPHLLCMGCRLLPLESNRKRCQGLRWPNPALAVTLDCGLGSGYFQVPLRQ